MRFWFSSPFSFNIYFCLLKRTDGISDFRALADGGWNEKRDIWPGDISITWSHAVIKWSTVWWYLTEHEMPAEITDFRTGFFAQNSLFLENRNIRLGEISWHNWSYDLSLWSHDWNILRSNVLLSIASAVKGSPCRPKYPGVWQTTYYFEKVLFICLFFVFSK